MADPGQVHSDAVAGAGELREWVENALRLGAFRVEQHGAEIARIPFTREELEAAWKREQGD
jgi:hypothetical protein